MIEANLSVSKSLSLGIRIELLYTLFMIPPRLTIALPCFNEEKYIIDTLKSIQQQTYSGYTVDIYDNNSSDKTLEMLHEFCQKDQRFRINKSLLNIGLLNNFRKSLNLSESEYFMWMGAHDLIEDNYLSELTNSLNLNASLALTFPRIKYLSFEGTVKLGEEFSNEFNAISPLKRYVSSIGGGRIATARMHGIFRREHIQECGNFEWNFGGMDHIFLSRAEFYGSEYNGNTSYIRRLWSEEKLEIHKGTLASQRYFAKSNKQYGLKKLTFIPLYQAYANDFFRLPLSNYIKIRYLPLLFLTITKKFEIKLMNNLLLYFSNTFSFHFRKLIRLTAVLFHLKLSDYNKSN